MNVLEPLLVALVVFAVRDGLLAWWLIDRLIGNGSAAVPPPLPPGPIVPEPPVGPVSPLPSLPLAKRAPRFTGITATSFAGSNDTRSSRSSAYDGKLIDGDQELAAALPAHGQGARIIRAFYNGRTVDAPVRDVGPWNGDPISTDDPYWATGARPQAETGIDKIGRKTNRAGIDLTPSAWKALGVGNPQNVEEKIDWDFVDVLDAPQASLPAPVPGTTGAIPAHLVLMRRYRDLGIHAQHDSTYIMAWPGAIAAKYPDMADYSKLYVHDTTPWCGLALADVLAENGIRPQFGPTDTDRYLWANAWIQFGHEVAHRDKATGAMVFAPGMAPLPGDICVYVWAGGGHHVTLYDHEEEDEFYHCTGGNQGSGHVVSTEAMPMKNCIAIRRAQVV